MKIFQGRTAVITGAGSGFGLEVARIAATRGMNLVLCDVHADALAKAAAEFEGRPVLAQVLDVSKADQMQALADAVQARFGAPSWTSSSTTPAWARAAWCGRTRWPTGNGCWA